jgi:MSHA biogenesis protein MshQ
MPLRRLLTMLPFLLLCAAGMTARAAETYSFSGAAVNGCSLSGKIYTCPALLPADTDKVVISNGYTVTANGDINFGYNQSLTITGSGVLKLSGKLDIGNINPANLNINGATLIAGGLFSMGAQAQTITANIQAGSMNLGTGSTLKITGNVTSTGAVAIASNTTIIGNVGGTTVTTNAPVTITGNVTATTSFTLASGSSVTGNVVTGELSLQAAEAIINGSATVNHATLDWHGRVTDTITCSGGTTAGQCDCVTNNSGYDIRKNANANQPGPYCVGKAAPLDHFVIGHDPTASVCAPTSVTVTACANAACTSLYTGGTTVTLTPASQAITLGSAGTATAAVMMPAVGKSTLGLTGGGASGATICKLNNGGGTSDCSVQVGDIALAVSAGTNNAIVAARADSTSNKLTIKALQYSDQTKQCVPLFAKVTRNIGLSFAYGDPGSGASAPYVAGTKLDTTARSFALDFDAQGIATPTIAYADAGQIRLNASYADQQSKASGSMILTSAPASFSITLGLPNKLIAGSSFTATVTAVNANGDKTPNFGAETTPVLVKLGAQSCNPFAGVHGIKVGANNNDVTSATPTSNVKGAQSFALRMDEAGKSDLSATVSAYLGTLSVNGSTAGGSICTGAVGTFVPAYFLVTPPAPPQPQWQRTTVLSDGTKLNQYYSDERQLKLTVTAMNAHDPALNLPDTATTNYSKNMVAKDVKLSLLDPQGSAVAAGVGSIVSTRPACVSKSNGANYVCAEDFAAGVATWTGGVKFSATKTAPLTANVRATEDIATDPVSSSAHPPEARVVIRSGRVRLSNVFGGVGKTVTMPIDVEYWDGSAWRRNVEDSTTLFPQSAFAIPPSAGLTATMGDIKNGSGALQLKPPANAATLSVPVALNLRSASAGADDACDKLTPKPASTGVDMGYFRVSDPNCTDTNPHDPWARASFGVFSAETRRIIHVREVFR